MKLEWIRCFHEVALTGSISKAAQNLFITQPAATKIIHSLEAELGETLLIRTSSGVTFTEQGVIFLKFCQQVLNSYENYLSEKNFYNETSAYSGVLELAVSPLLLQTYYDEIMQRLTQCFPKLKIRFTEAGVDNYKKMLSDNNSICGLIMTSDEISLQQSANDHNLFVTQELLTSPIVLCASRHSKYASLTDAQLAEKLASEDMVAIAGGKQNTYTYFDAHDLYTTNLDIVRKRLLYNEDAYVMMSELVAYKKLIDKDIVLLQKTKQKAKIEFLYHQDTIYPANFLTRLALELKTAISK